MSVAFDGSRDWFAAALAAWLIGWRSLSVAVIVGRWLGNRARELGGGIFVADTGSVSWCS
jgi:hypothetical protein